MRILFVTPYVPSLIRLRSFNFLRELSKRHEVVVLTMWESEREREDLAALNALYPAVGLHLSRARAYTNCLRALPGSTPLQGSYCQTPEFTRLVDLALDPRAPGREVLPAPLRRPFDLVHVEHMRAAYVGRAIPLTMPAVVDSVDCITLLMERTRQHSHRLWQRLLAAFELSRMAGYEAKVLGYFDYVTVCTPDDAVVMRELIPGLRRVAPVNHCVDLDYFRMGGQLREPDSMVFVGKMSYHANATAVNFFVREVLPRIRALRPSARLQIVGSDPPWDVRVLARQHDVTITGYTPDVRPYLGRARVAVAPMVVKVGIQSKIIEAMAAGTPVVVTTAGTEGLEATPGRDLLVADDPDEFARQVVRLFDDDVLWRRLIVAGRQYVEIHHRWDVAAEQLEQVYADAVAARESATSVLSESVGVTP